MSSSKVDPDEEARLLARKAELEALLARVNRSLKDAGYRLDASSPPSALKSGLNIGGKLSFRGIETAGELFDFLDEDKDGFLTFSDARALHSVVYERVPSDLTMTSREAWQASMHECGVELRDDGKLDREQFVRWKMYCEEHCEQSLEHELRTLGLPLLPRKLQQWKTLREAWAEYEGFVRGDLRGFLLEDESISLDEISFVLCGLGVVIPKAQLYDEMLLLYRKRNAMDEIKLRAYRRQMFANSQRFKEEMVEEYSALKDGRTYTKRSVNEGLPKFLSVPGPTLFGWCFADRPPIESTVQLLNRMSLRAKITAELAIRKLRRAVVLAEAIEENLRRRATFVGLEPVESEAAMFTSSLTVGDLADGNESMAARLKLSHIGNVRQAIATLKLPSDTGTALMIDLLLRVNVTEDMITRAVKSLRAVLTSQFTPEFQHFRTFKAIQVYQAVNDTSDAPIIRIAVIFRRESSLESLFARNRLNWGLADLVNDFSVQLSCSLHLSDLLQNPSLVLQTALGVSVTASLSVQQQLTVNVMERLARAMKWAPAQKIVDRAMTARQPPDASIFTSRRHISTSYDDLETHEFTKMFAPTIKKWAEKALHWLRSWRDGACHLQVSVAQAVSLLSQFFPALRSQAHLSEGFVQKWFNPYYRRLRKEMQQLAADVQRHEELEKERKRQQHQRMLLSTEVDEGQEKVDQEHRRVLEQLRRLNIKVKDSAGLWGGRKGTTPESAAEAAHAAQLLEHKLALEAFDACCQACIGIDGISLFMGKAQLSLSCEGFDLFDVLPRPPSMPRGSEPKGSEPKEASFHEKQCW